MGGREFDFPQRLKPIDYGARSGTAKGVPFQITFTKPLKARLRRLEIGCPTLYSYRGRPAFVDGARVYNRSDMAKIFAGRFTATIDEPFVVFLIGMQIGRAHV